MAKGKETVGQVTSLLHDAEGLANHKQILGEPESELEP